MSFPTQQNKIIRYHPSRKSLLDFCGGTSLYGKTGSPGVLSTVPHTIHFVGRHDPSRDTSKPRFSSLLGQETSNRKRVDRYFQTSQRFDESPQPPILWER